MISYVGVQGRADAQSVTDYMCRICEKTSEVIKFAEIVLLTAAVPSFQPKNTRVIFIQPMNYDQYNEMAFKYLHRWVKSDFIMNFQDDGFAINPHNWSDSFLNYDYLGAPWPIGCGWSWQGREVGNGGFSLRSRKLYRECESLPISTGVHEDGVICVQYRDYLMSKGIKFADWKTGYDFSIDLPFDENHSIEKCFGFHGKGYVEKANQILGVKS
jgi:hypothetical protein